MRSITLTLAIVGALAGSVQGSARLIKEWSVPVALTSGSLSNSTAQSQEKLLGDFAAPGAARVRVAMTGAALGASSKVRFTSLQDGQSQTLDAAQLAMWSRKSALFNGDTVRVEVVLAPGDSQVSVQVNEVLAFSDEPVASEANHWSGDPTPETLCGPDNRVASTDNRSGRLNGGCTGWLVSNGAVLAAGHCDTAAGQILEVNVPASQPNGALVAAAVQNQFPVIDGTVVSINNGAGNDWAVFRVGPNNLNQVAHHLHGFFRMTRELPAVGAITRITGCGVDNTPPGTDPNTCGARNDAGDCTHPAPNAQTQTQQTSTGTFTSETGTGGGIELQYAVDTEPANSGSPVIWEANGFTIGIHTNGGCTSSGGANSGTSFEHRPLEDAIARVPGPNCFYLDRVKAPGGAENGTVFYPHDTLAEAVAAVPVGGILSVVAGDYTAAGTTLNKRMTISAPVGLVRLGN